MKRRAPQHHADLKTHAESIKGLSLVYRGGELRPLFMMGEF